MEEQNECRTKAELMQENESLLCENETLQDAKEKMKEQIAQLQNDKDYWLKAWNEEYRKNGVYVKRLKAMQHTIALLASTIGEIDITALTKEENA